jgi:ribosome biogenesis GTPase
LSTLEDLGWSATFAAAFEEIARRELEPARVAEEQRERFHVLTASGPLPAAVSGRLRHETARKEDRPAVGDWIAAERHPDGRGATIHHVLPRRSALRRKAAGRAGEAQVVAANVDTVFLVTSLNRDFNPRRIERFLALVREGGARPVLVLNKADLCGEPGPLVGEAGRVAPGVPVHALSAATGAGVEALAPYLARGSTAALVGSSGVGKSTLVNRLAGRDLQVVREARVDDDRGLHTTTARQLLVLECGALLVDTPGVREVALLGDESAVAAAFEDIEALARECRFQDCSHGPEPGCAVLRALRSGRLAQDRYESWTKLRRELEHVARKDDHRARLEQKRKWKRITKAHRRRE